MTAVGDDINDLELLTPNYLLTGAPSMNYSLAVFRSKETESRKKWRAAQAAANIFWVRWTHEYLALLSIRKK